MKKILYCSIIATLFLGCKKSSDQSPFMSYLRFNLDGVRTECNNHIRATYLPSTIGPDEIISISGDWSGGSIELKIQNPSSPSQPLTPMKYIFEPFTQRSGTIWITGPTGSLYGAGSCFFCPQVDGSGSITITEISPEYVKGSFEFITAATYSTFKTVTNGEFHIKRG